MLSSDFIQIISEQLDQPILKVETVSGGDISSAYKLNSEYKNYFVKVNSNEEAIHMFEAEKLGLELIASTECIAVPQVFACSTFDNTSFIVMEYLKRKSPSEIDMNQLGNALAMLHQFSYTDFGLDHNNFIGSLIQQNKVHSSWTNFYIEERLLPQFRLARLKAYLSEKEMPSLEMMRSVCSELFDNVKPALLHGDLWSGNYLISGEGVPFLIDPAVYFGHHEVDIAMSKLFGGFSSSFYDAYFRIHPKTSNFNKRIQLYQLYYLLVHLNIFGTSYHGSVSRILKTLF